MVTAASTRAPGVLAVVLGVLLLGLSCPARASADPVSPTGPDPVGGWPLSPTPEVAQGFDPPASTYGVGHRGVDLVGRAGQQVRSALPGTVTYAGLIAGVGIVVVDHGPTRTTYQPVAAVVHVGDVVAEGTPIGQLEAGGSHCLPRTCLHWGWIADPDTYLDPLRLVGAGPVRLLPLTGLPAGPSAPTPVSRVFPPPQDDPDPFARVHLLVTLVERVVRGLRPEDAPARRRGAVGPS